MNSTPLCFQPRVVPKVWGGLTLHCRAPGAFASDTLIGESWELSEVPGAESVCATERCAGMTVSQALAACAAESQSAAVSTPFPILVKLLDMQGKLSIQVHPPQEFAPRSEPQKDESWIVLAADAAARIYCGWRDDVSAADIRATFGTRNMIELMNVIKPTPGQVLNIPAGVIHGATGPLQIVEIQRTADTTYRAYDWDQVDATTGTKRALHVAEALRCVAMPGAAKRSRAFADLKSKCVTAFASHTIDAIRDQSIEFCADEARIVVSRDESSTSNPFAGIAVELLPAGVRFSRRLSALLADDLTALVVSVV